MMIIRDIRNWQRRKISIGSDRRNIAFMVICRKTYYFRS